ARMALRLDLVAHAAARIDQQTERQGQVRLLSEITDRLGLALILNGEVFFLERTDHLAVFVLPCGVYIYHVDVGPKRCGLRARVPGKGCAAQNEAPPSYIRHTLRHVLFDVTPESRGYAK